LDATATTGQASPLSNEVAEIQMDEVEWALRKSNAKKAPGPDGISSAFYTEN